MAEAWTDLNDSDLAQDKPLRQSIVRALRDNPEGIAAGVAGAPQIQTAAIATSAVTTAKLESSERMNAANVRAIVAAFSAGSVGTYAQIASHSSSGLTFGDSISGGTFGLSGTWRVMRTGSFSSGILSLLRIS
jgi:hypothetical protein